MVQRIKANSCLKGFIANLLLLFVLLGPVAVQASHLLGGELTHEEHPTNPFSYRFKLVLYGDPSGITLPITTTIRELGSSSSFTASQVNTYNLYPTCTDTVVVATYVTNYININTNDFFKVYYYSECCRPPGSSNLVQSELQGLFLKTTVKRTNLSVDFDNSAVFLGASNFTITANQTSQISFAADDPDGDSLHYRLVTAKQFSSGNEVPLDYEPNHGPHFPFDSNTTVFMDELSGLFTIVSPSIGDYTVVCRVDGYREGILVNRIFRDINIRSIGQPVNTYNPKITVSGLSQIGSTKIDSTYYITAYEGNTISATLNGFSIHPSGASSPNLTMSISSMQNLDTANGGTCSGGGCISLNGNLQDTGSVTGLLTFTPPIGFVDTTKAESRFVEVLAEIKVNDWCGGKKSGYATFVIEVRRPSISANQNYFQICKGDSAQVNISGDNNNLSWSPLNGVSNPSGNSVWLRPDSTTTYTITNLNDNSYLNILVTVEPIKNGPSLVLSGTLIEQLPNPAPLSTWYYNGFELTSGQLNFQATNGSYYTKPESSQCLDNSDTLVVNIGRQSALVDEPFDSIIILNDIQTLSFVFEGTDRSNTLEEIYIMGNKQFFNSTSTYEVEDLNGVEPTKTGNLFFDAIRKRMVIGSTNLQLPFTASSRYKITLASTSANLYDLTFYKESSLPFIDSKGMYQITSSMVLATNSSSYTNLHLPIVASFANEVIGAEENDVMQLVSVYPNPTMNQFRVEALGNETVKFFLRNALGEIVLEEEFVGDIDLTIAGLPAGIYIYQVECNKKHSTGQLVKF